jgi:hypothetical protein
VLGEFFDQPESVDRVLRCVMQHVEFDEPPGKKIEAGTLL